MSKTEKLREELQKYALISAYLFICFTVALLYEASVQPEGHASSVSLGVALVKALVMGKFILIGDMISIGSRADHHPLLHRVAWKSLAMLALLIVFKILEELIVGWFHDQSVREVMQEFLTRSLVQNLAPILLMLMILIPLITATELFRSMGSEQFKKALLER